ncbi:glycerophosphoryl diester phosphodiesterase [Metabacillus crassostreae]|uniref:glycerophosphodiester phosphodiesterase n=1 Tax=Metabacillus crassostreae TaxID=929098 RepID=UPI00195C45D7|nr:glycerophosphodiester phosphodiesterase [Metabacillus crassostreae]MBM7604982.1 glycerophosphoryl diester phosphodiesterase [Metabacillus crassostreae]
MGETKQFFAHRGVSGEYPENTMAAFRAAAKVKAHGIELDVQLTKDGEVVVIHDETIDRTTNGIGYVKDFVWNQLKRFDAGSWFHPKFSRESVPLLEEVLQWVTTLNYPLLVNVELKNDIIDYPELEEKVLQLIDLYHLQSQCILSSFNKASLKKINELNHSIETAYLIEGIPVDILKVVENIPVKAIHCEASFAQSIIGKKVQERGYPIRVFTINTMNEYNNLIKSNVSAIITDYPEIFLENKVIE